MTKEEKLSILGAKLVEVYEAIRDTDVKDEAMPRLLDMTETLEWKLERMELPEGIFTDPDVDVPQPDIAKGETAPAPAAPAPASTKPTMTKVEMVSKLTKFRDNGVAIDKVMESMGFPKLSEVPADRYMELLELCQEALDGEG